MFKLNYRQFIHAMEKMSHYCHQHHICLSQWCVSKHTLTYGSDAFTELFHLPRDLLANKPREAEKHNDKDSDEEDANGGSLH